ncbi:DegV family protein [Solimonas terrae]|uniref:DegV family EDD domain-containing protein n=1 Tax=Solimonas terrae TaxID=1396819 RepID=A0A6M2BXD7_9GAMM|nr:DegV family protein [Solimonas terrae]NGY06527.1 DegV family EDD domain-containing protein [Solimonas terrae]
MRIGVIADASCDLPEAFLHEHDIGILPVTIQLGADSFDDHRDAAQTRRFYAEQLAARGLDAETQACSVEQTRSLLREQLMVDRDYAFCITLSATRGRTFENTAKASFAILADAQSGEQQAQPLALRVIDSKTMFSGTGVLVAEAAKLARAGVTPFEMRRRLEILRDSICAYMVPGDLYYLRNRAQHKGERSVDWFSYAIGTALDLRPVLLGYRGETQAVARLRGYEHAVERMFAHVARQVEAGLELGHLCVSYGGELERLAELPGYAALQDATTRHGIQLLASVMSATAAVNVGAGCVSVAYGGELRPFRL